MYYLYMYRVWIKRSAQKEIAALHPQEQERVNAAIKGLASVPRPVDQVKKIEGNTYRIRVGGVRILYTIEDKILLVEVIEVEKRGDAYRKKSRRRRRK